MSFNRENVTWISRDGTWSIGFYSCYPRPDAEDPEWDVDYDYNRFDWASTGHPNEGAARASWDGANPGGGEVVDAAGPETDRLDAIAAQFLAVVPTYRGFR